MGGEKHITTMASTSTCTTAQLQQGADHPSAKQHTIQCAEETPSKRIGEIHNCTTAPKGTCPVPAPAKFNRKATCFERVASANKISTADMCMEEERKRIYVSHRQYVQSLILETEAFDESSSLDLWAVCESLFEIN